MPKVDARYRIEGNELLLFPLTPKAAVWIGKNSTTNVCDTIYYEIDRGMQVVGWMAEDGLRVGKRKKH